MIARRALAGFIAATCLATAAHAAALPAAPDATLELMGGSFALGIGVDWASGTLRYEGREIPIDVHGVSIMRIGASNFSATGEVYNLHDPADMAGHFTALSAGGGVLHGGSFVTMRNDKGVVVRMTTSSGGIDLDFGVKGLAMSLH